MKAKRRRKAAGKSSVGFDIDEFARTAPERKEREEKQTRRSVPLSVTPGSAADVRYIVEMSGTERRWITLYIANGFTPLRVLHIEGCALAGVIEGLSEARRMLEGQQIKEFSEDNIPF